MKAPKTKTVSMKQFMVELQERTEAYLHHKFTWVTIETWILTLLKNRVEDIVMAALGYVWEDRHWRVAHPDRRSSGLQRVLGEMADVLAAKHVPTYLQAVETTLVNKVLSPSNIKRMCEHYSDAFQAKLNEAAEDWILTQTTTQLEALMARHEGTFLEAIKLKRKLTMGSIELLAQNDGDEEDEDEDR